MNKQQTHDVVTIALNIQNFHNKIHILKSIYRDEHFLFRKNIQTFYDLATLRLFLKIVRFTDVLERENQAPAAYQYSYATFEYYWLDIMTIACLS